MEQFLIMVVCFVFILGSKGPQGSGLNFTPNQLQFQAGGGHNLTFPDPNNQMQNIQLGTNAPQILQLQQQQPNLIPNLNVNFLTGMYNEY